MDDSPPTATAASTMSRADRKAEGKRLKRERIDSGGGKRPRVATTTTTADGKKAKQRRKKRKSGSSATTTTRTTVFVRGSGGQKQDASSTKGNDSSDPSSSSPSSHRFGRVMEKAPCLGRPVRSTVSIAVPGSILDNCQTRELRTVAVGQIARAAVIHHVDEIVVFDDGLGSRRRPRRRRWRDGRRRPNGDDDENDSRNRDRGKNEKNDDEDDDESSSDACTFMARVLQFCECPQYLRRAFFPMHPDLRLAGLLPPLDAPHHVRAGERSLFREGVVLEPKSNNNNNDGETVQRNSLVNAGLREGPVEIDRVLAPGLRCTVRLDDEKNERKGVVVGPSAPRERDGTYWGYATRLASSLREALDGGDGGAYDLKIGTSERGDVSVDDDVASSCKGPFRLPDFERALIVFGGVAGIEECVDADENLKVAGRNSRSLFDVWVNTCPYQGSRTVRTEEAVMISLARLRPHVLENERRREKREANAAVNETRNKDDSKSNVTNNDDVSLDDESVSSEESGEGD